MTSNNQSESKRLHAVSRRAFSLVMTAALVGAMAACTGKPAATAPAVAESGAASGEHPATWTEASHGGKAEPDYAAVFPQDKVNELQLTIAPEDWQAMLDDMTKLYGARGSGGMGGGRQPGQPRPSRSPGGSPMPLPSGSPFAIPSGAPNNPGLGGPGMGGPGMSEPMENPMWVKATVSLNGKTWTKVGLRFKGNSSLRSAWQSGTDNLPIKLEFDHWEDDAPEIKDQRLYGFKTVSLATNWGDSSYMRDAVVNDVLQDAGLVSAETGFYKVSLDRGTGAQPLGLYTMIEEIDDTVIKRFFKGDDGNIYKPDGNAASLAAGSRDGIESVFQKENNKKSDWSDVQKLYDVLHDARRTTDAAAWRQSLEAVLDVDTFLHVLAVLAVAQDWDSYGQMAHNYYLYNNPANGKLTWIAWDHNLALGAQGGGGMPGGGAGQFPGGAMPDGAPMVFPSGAPAMGGGRSSVSLDKKDVTDRWPLIRYLLDQPSYYDTYVRYLRETVNGPFQAATMQSKYERYAQVLASSVPVQADFQTAVKNLTQATQDRVKAVNDFLAAPAASPNP